MKTREWLFTIAIIILIQFIVQVGALIYSNDNNVLNYISFAGTLISIILATIAIVYSFVQTISQQSASSNISNQVDKLISVVDQIHDSKNIINTSIDHLRRASEKLDTAIENQSNIHKEVQTISNKFSDLDLVKSFQSEKINAHQASNEHRSPSITITVNNILDCNDGIKLCIIIFYWGSKKEMSLEKIIDLIVKPTLNKMFEDSENIEDLISFFEGALTSSLFTLELCNLMYVDDNKILLDTRIAQECSALIEQTKKTNEDTILKTFVTAYTDSES